MATGELLRMRHDGKCLTAPIQETTSADPSGCGQEEA